MFLVLLLNFILVFLIYFPCLNGYFLGEDYAWWPSVAGKSFFEVLRYFVASPTKALAGYYHPLVGLSYWLNVKLSPMNPVEFHLTNLFVHFGNYLLVTAIAYFFFKKKWAALLAGFLFIIFPFHSEAVAWIDGRHDLLMTFFYLLSFYLFLRWHKNKKGIFLVTSVFSFSLALSAKEMAVTLPLTLTFMVYILRCQANPIRDRNRFTPPVWFWFVLFFYFFLHASYVGHFNPFGAASHLSFIISRVFIFYLIFLSGSLIFFRWAGKKKILDKENLKLAPFLAILIGIFYFPAAFTFTEERYLYLPSTVACIFLANLFFLFWSQRWVAKNKLLKTALISLLVVCSAISVKYLKGRIFGWEKAAQIAQKTVYDFKVLAKDISEEATIYFLNLPDNYHGSYIFRTHVASAIQYGSGKKFKKIIFLPTTLTIGESRVEILAKGHLRLVNPGGYLIFSPIVNFIYPNGDKLIENEEYQLLAKKGEKELELTLKKDYLGAKNVIFFEFKDQELLKIVDVKP